MTKRRHLKRFFKIPSVADVPDQMNVSLLRYTSDRPAGACYNSKGIGEAATSIGVAGTLNAVRAAVADYRRENKGGSGWFHLDVPATADKIRMAAKDDVTEFIGRNLGSATETTGKRGFEP